jgi:hypothetical protein
LLGADGIQFEAGVSDIHGVSTLSAERGVIDDQSRAMLPVRARGALQRDTEERPANLDADLSPFHMFVPRHTSDSIDAMHAEIADVDPYPLRAAHPNDCAHPLLQTITGIDAVAAPLMLVEIGDDMA